MFKVLKELFDFTEPHYHNFQYSLFFLKAEWIKSVRMILNAENSSIATQVQGERDTFTLAF